MSVTPSKDVRPRNSSAPQARTAAPKCKVASKAVTASTASAPPARPDSFVSKVVDDSWDQMKVLKKMSEQSSGATRTSTPAPAAPGKATTDIVPPGTGIPEVAKPPKVTPPGPGKTSTSQVKPQAPAPRRHDIEKALFLIESRKHSEKQALAQSHGGELKAEPKVSAKTETPVKKAAAPPAESRVSATKKSYSTHKANALRGLSVVGGLAALKTAADEFKKGNILEGTLQLGSGTGQLGEVGCDALGAFARSKNGTQAGGALVEKSAKLGKGLNVLGRVAGGAFAVLDLGKAASFYAKGNSVDGHIKLLDSVAGGLSISGEPLSTTAGIAYGVTRSICQVELGKDKHGNSVTLDTKVSDQMASMRQESKDYQMQAERHSTEAKNVAFYEGDLSVYAKRNPKGFAQGIVGLREAYKDARSPQEREFLNFALERARLVQRGGR